MEFSPKLISTLRQSQHVAVLTGAGISAESGVPTFREAQTGLWAKYEPQELATPQAFQRNPKLVWEWYAWRRELVQQAAPNPGHHALAKLAMLVPKLTLITQNVDGLHQQAGSPEVICLHGNITETKCYTNNHFVKSWPNSAALPPKCPTCGSLLRPNVVLFGENLPADALRTAVQASQSCDIFFSIGTSALVHPAAMLPMYALDNQALLVEINPQPTQFTHYANEVLTGASGQILPALVAAAFGE